MSPLIKVARSEVDIYESKHFLDRKKERKFPITILGRAGLRVANQKIGEVRKYTDGHVTVVIKRLSAESSLLLTGYKNGDSLTHYENNVLSRKIDSIDGWR